MHEPAPQATQRKVGFAVVLVGAILVLWVVGLHLLGQSTYEREMSSASVSVSNREWSSAAKHFREAAASSILDKDAIFGLHLMERVQGGDALTGFEASIRDGDLLKARAAAEVESDPKLRSIQTSFLDQVELKAE